MTAVSGIKCLTLQVLSALPARELILFACRTARRALEAEVSAGQKSDPACWKAIETAERHSRGQAPYTERWPSSRAAWVAASYPISSTCEAAWAAYYAIEAACRVDDRHEVQKAAIETAYWATSCAYRIIRRDSKGHARETQERARQLADLLGVLAR